MSKAGYVPPEPDAPALELSEDARAKLEQFREAHETQVLTILLSDLEDSTQLQSDEGNLGAADVVQAHREVFRQELAKYDGQEIETAGDLFLAVFATPSEGVKFAIHLQAAMRRVKQRVPNMPALRLGLHQGQVVVERHDGGPKAMDIYGLQVSTTSRIMSLAAGGQTLCSRAVFDDARAILRAGDFEGLRPIAWRNHGPYRFKGVEDPYDVCEVGEDFHAPLRQPRGGTKAWPADLKEEELGWRPAIGVTIPDTNWLLEQKMGQGEFGEVWKAWNGSSKSYRVFKFCFRREHVKALKREARLLHRLARYRHPGLVEVYDVTEGEQPPHYLEMEFVDGVRLDSWLDLGPPKGLRLEVVAQVADALQVVHAAGIFHRDIKPANIIIAHADGGLLQAKLTDFGLGATDDPDLLRTLYASKPEGVAGTWDYIAPELRAWAQDPQGAKPQATPQSDLYALGLTLYQVAVGDAQATLSPGWEARVNDEVLAEDIAKCLDPDPAKRWARAADLSAALRSHHERTESRRIARERQAQAVRVQRLRRTATAAAAVAVLALSLGSLAAWQWRVAELERQTAETARTAAEQAETEAVEARDAEAVARQDAESAQERAEDQAYYSGILLAQSQIGNRRYDLAQQTLADLAESRRAWEWAYLNRLCNLDEFTLAPHNRPVLKAIWNADGSRIVTLPTSREAALWDATGALVARIDGHTDYIADVAFSPDGRTVATASHDGHVRLWNAEDGTDAGVDVEIAAQMRAVAFHPSGTTFATAASDGMVRTWNAADGAPIGAWGPFQDGAGPNYLRHVSFLADGAYIGIGSRSRNVFLVVNAAAPGQPPQAEWPCSRQSAGYYADPTGRWLVLAEPAAVGGAVVVRDLLQPLDASEVARIPAPGVQITSLQVVVQNDSPIRVVAGLDDGTARSWSLPGGGAMPPFGHHGEGNVSVAVNEAGTRIATSGADGLTRIWAPDNPEPLAVLAGHSGPIMSARFLAGTPRLLTASADRTAKVWDTVQPKSGPLRAYAQGGAISALAVDDAAQAAAAGDATGRLWLYRPFGDGAPRELAANGTGAHGAEVSGVAFVNGGSTLASIGRDAMLRVWDTGAQGGLAREVRLSTGLSALTAAAQSEQLVVGDEAGAIHVLSAIDLNTERTYPLAVPAGLDPATAGDPEVHQLWPLDTAMTAIAARQGWTCGYWNLASGDYEPVALAGRDITALWSDPESPYAAAGTQDGALIIWAKADPAAQRTIPDAHLGIVSGLVGLPDHGAVLSYGGDGDARLWDLASGELRATFGGHARFVAAAAYCPAIGRIMTADGEGTVYLWRVDRPAAVAVLAGGHRAPVRHIQTLQRGSETVIVTASDDGAVCFWGGASLG